MVRQRGPGLQLLFRNVALRGRTGFNVFKGNFLICFNKKMKNLEYLSNVSAIPERYHGRLNVPIDKIDGEFPRRSRYINFHNFYSGVSRGF